MAESSGAADDDELPSMLWGLDPVFSAYSKLYIVDILQMRESRHVPGVYFYKTHPIFQVDVLGTVVCKREREDFYCYGVDDSTGVINCLCWKDEKWRDQGEPTTDKVDDPVMAVQISRMLEMPQLYKTCYDKPVQVPSEELGGKQSGGPSNFQYLVSRSVLTLKEFLSEKEVARFRPYDVEYLLHPLVQTALAEQEPDQPTTSFSTQIRNLLKETLGGLQEEGKIFRKMRTQDEVYNVTEQDKDLHTVIKDILREDTKREKYAEKGCHILHILSSVRQRYSQNMTREALEVALTFLECNSDIISTTAAHYTVL